jgi:methylated-DNA-[protein]-cysteine S-methyltransferase
MTDNCDIRKRVMQAADITEFQRRVYMELLNVPTGTTITYSELARRIGCSSAQAVGQALKRNPFAPDVPCHRLVATNGSIGGYFGKREGEMIERKRILLKEEQEQMKNR